MDGVDMMEAPEKWTFDAPYTASFNGSGDDTWLGLKSHGMLVASFAVKQWGSEQACIEAAWRHAYEPTADLAQAPAPVRVKDLEWVELEVPDIAVFEALTCLGRYKVQERTVPGWMLVGTNGTISVHGSEEAAKAAAQADYEARILAALEPDADQTNVQKTHIAPDAGVVAELVEAAKALRNAVCGPTGFAEAVRHNTGLALPWPSLDAAEERLARALALIAHNTTEG